ncbi:helix-turn-helix transcriptional regulator [Nocardioides bizhenqiangii]|uniref:Helix-turn-helix transcriptional regulator n=1 Tax=Nocardioides bizhenqiangii TaxID=3095076 RepID=A0ABZ0ZTK8_9ACTN|nr:helix-turn-helix transcriptional regulator [Nocardioides sp. HM61]WQQ27658.1 helix-turn-helix transcriptional regulator [Nocardioides sp. HM61]
MPNPIREPNFQALRIQFSRLRNEHGWSYDELADRTGITRRTLISIETGQTNGSLDTWFRLAQAFGMPLGDLLAPLGSD